MFSSATQIINKLHVSLIQTEHIKRTLIQGQRCSQTLEHESLHANQPSLSYVLGFSFLFFFFASILLYNVIKVGIVHLKMKILLLSFTQAQVFSNKRKIFCRMSVTRELIDPHSRKKNTMEVNGVHQLSGILEYTLISRRFYKKK